MVSIYDCGFVSLFSVMCNAISGSVAYLQQKKVNVC